MAGCPIFAAFFAAKVEGLTFGPNPAMYHLWYNALR
jgi:hypothetical protein